jgi:DNA topoisomerase IB
VPVRSEDINSWLSEVMGGAFTAKDFRTWAATSLTVRLLAEMPLPTEHSNPISEKEFSELEKTVVAQVASALGNTVSVCRNAYIDPTVFSGWRSGELHAYCAQALTSRQWEQRTITFLKRAKRKSTR